jgi:hypothetical protein
MPVTRHNGIGMVRLGKCQQVVVVGIGRLERTVRCANPVVVRAEPLSV